MILRIHCTNNFMFGLNIIVNKLYFVKHTIHFKLKEWPKFYFCSVSSIIYIFFITHGIILMRRQNYFWSVATLPSFVTCQFHEHFQLDFRVPSSNVDCQSRYVNLKQHHLSIENVGNFYLIDKHIFLTWRFSALRNMCHD